jgi:hypothetical protein
VPGGGSNGVLLSAGAGGMSISASITGGGGGPVTLLSDGPITFGKTASIDTAGAALEVAPATPGIAEHAGGLGAGLSFGTLPVRGGRPADETTPPNLVRFGGFTDPRTGAVVTTAGQLELNGPWYPTGLTVQTLDLRASGAVTQTVPITSLAPAGVLTGSAGSVTLTNADNRIAMLGSFSATGDFLLTDAGTLSVGAAGGLTAGGDVTLIATRNLTVAGLVSANNITLEVTPPGGELSMLAGTVGDGAASGPGVLRVPTGNRISLLADLIDIPTVPKGVAGPAIVAPNGLVEFAPFTQGRPVVFADDAVGDSLTVSTADLRAITPGTGTLHIGGIFDEPVPRAGPIALQQSIDLTGIATTLRLDATGSITQNAGALTVVDLTGSAGTFANLAAPTNRIGTLGAFSTLSGFTLVDDPTLQVTGPVTVTGPASTLSLTTKASDIVLTGDVGTASGTVRIDSSGAITQSGNSAVFSGPGGTVDVHAGTDLIQSGSARIFGDTVSVSAGRNLQQSDNAFITTVLNGRTNTNTVAVGGDVNQSGRGAILAANAVAVTAGGHVVQSGFASILSAASSVTIDAKGGMTMSANASLTAPTIRLTAGPGGIALNDDARLGQSGSLIDITSAGPVTEASTAAIIAGTLTTSGGIVGAATLPGTANTISVLQNVAVTGGTGSLQLADSVNLLLAGTLDAARILIHAPGRQIILGDGATIVTGGATRPSGSLGALREPGNSAAGASLEAANFTQLGSSTVRGQGGGPATLRISTTGQAQFAPSSGLLTSGTWLILDIGSGTAAGNVAVDALDVVYTTPGSANLTGTVHGIAGGAAAQAAFIQPASNINYLFNGCEIAAATCQPPDSPQGSNPPGSPPGLQPPGSPPGSAPPGSPTGPSTTPLETATLIDAAQTSALGGLYQQYLGGAPPQLIGLSKLVLVALPTLPGSLRRLTDSDVVPPNISYLDY